MLCYISQNLAVDTTVGDISIEQHFTGSILIFIKFEVHI